MTRQAKQKPELLLPSGNTESFYAALEAGADAVYLGAKQFNARERAGNFLPAQLKRLVEIAHEYKAESIYDIFERVFESKLVRLFQPRP